MLAEGALSLYTSSCSLSNFEQVFGQGTNRTIGYIIAEPAMKDGTGTEAIDTVTPLANALGLEIDTSW